MHAGLPTQRVPIVFAPEIARSLIGNIFEAANGDSIYRGASFWTNQLGQQVASANVTVIDDGTMPGLFGTAPFDGEGLPTRRTVIVEKGVLKNYLLNTYTGRKLNMQSTGQCFARIGRHPRHRRRQPLSRERHGLPAAAACRCARPASMSRS